MEHRCALAAFVWLLSTGCSAGGDAGQGDAYVLLDRAAREGSVLVHDGWEGAPVLPVALDPSQPARRRVPDGREFDVPLTPGVLSYVRGETSAVDELDVGSEVRADRLLLHASEGAAGELAETIGGSVAARGDGLFTITAPELLMKTSFLTTGEDLLEAMPDTWVGTETIEPTNGDDSNSALLGPTADELEAAARGELGRREALLVGLYRSPRSLLILDALGRFSLEGACDGEVKAEGFYHASEGRVVLQSKETGAVALAVSGKALIKPTGERLTLMEPGNPIDSLEFEIGAW